MRRLLAWARWEFGREIEVTPAIRLITIERFLKGGLLIVGGVVLLVISNRGDGLRQLSEQLQDQLNLQPGRGVLRRLYEETVIKLGSYSRAREDAIAIGAILYGALEAFEGVGLLLRRRWAEYLVVVATSVFLPLEIEELLRSPTPFKAAALVVNVLIVAYLIWRKRLFWERPGSATTVDATGYAADHK